jgi:hypothetical protein
MNYLYVTDAKLKDKLLNQQYELLQELNNINQTIWIFALNPDGFTFNLKEFEALPNNGKCFISDKLMMCF